MTHVTGRLTAKYRDQLRNPTVGNRVWANFSVHIARTRVRELQCELSPTRARNYASQFAAVPVANHIEVGRCDVTLDVRVTNLKPSAHLR